MSNLNQLKPSFSAGELSPSMYARVDMAKYDSGCSKMENFLVMQHGGACNRAGTKFIAETKNSAKAKLIPFQFSTTQNYILEFTPGFIRVYMNGGIVIKDNVPYEIVTPYLVNIEKIKYTQSADMLFIFHPNQKPRTLTRYNHNDWKLAEMEIKGGPFKDATNLEGITLTASAVSGEISVTASKAVFKKEHVGGYLRIGHMVASAYKKAVPLSAGYDLTIEVTPKGTVYAESYGFWDGDWSLEEYDTPSNQWIAIRKIDGNRTQNYNITETNNSDEIKLYRITSTRFNIDAWSGENEKQRGYVTLQAFANDYYGYGKITEFVSDIQVKMQIIKKLGKTDTTTNWSLGYWSEADGYPTCGTFYQDRLVIAANRENPQTYWTSKNGDYFNFGTSVPTSDDDGVIATLNSTKMNRIRAIVPFSEMIMLTAGGEFKVSGGGNNGILSPSNNKSEPQEYRGISEVDPVIIGSRIVYVQTQGNVVRDLAYQYDVDKYTGIDLTLLATHLFERHQIVSIAYQQIPNSIVWCVREDGVLLGLTYLREQEVYAWHRHVTEGEFVDVASIPGTDEDEVWLVVKRDGKYFIELMAERMSSTKTSEQFFVDSGLIYKGNPVSRVSGLEHLSGKKVAVLADGNVINDIVVDSKGAISLGNLYSTVIVGLPITATLIPLPVEITAQSGTYLAKKKRIDSLNIMVTNSLGGRYGCREDRLDEIKWRTNEPYGKAITLFSGKKKINIPSATFSDDANVIIKQLEPLPLTILAIIPEVTISGS